MKAIDLNNNDDFRNFFYSNLTNFNQLDEDNKVIGQEFEAIKITGDLLDTLEIEEDSFKGPDGQVFNRGDYIAIDLNSFDFEDRKITAISKEHFENTYERTHFLPVNEERGRKSERENIDELELPQFSFKTKSNTPENNEQRIKRSPK